MCAKKYIGMLVVGFTLCSMVIAQEVNYERSVNNMGKVIHTQTDVPITRVAGMLLPNGWRMAYMNDEMRNLVVSWHSHLGGKIQSWHEALKEIGVAEHLVFLVDGAEKSVYVTYPGYGRDPGTEIINSSSVVFEQDSVMKEIIARAKANEMNFKRRQLQQDIGRYQTQKAESLAQLTRLNDERARVERQMALLNTMTSNAVSVIEQKQAELDSRSNKGVTAQSPVGSQHSQPAEMSVTGEKSPVEPPANFVFYVRTGLVLNDNARRFAKDLGYDVMVVDKKVPENCDWQQEVEYSIQESDRKKAFAEYVAPYGFKPNFTGTVVELVYMGSAESFKGCA